MKRQGLLLIAAFCLAASGAVSSARADDWEQGGQSSPGFEQSPSGDFDAATPQDTSESDRLRDENDELRRRVEELERQAAEAKDEKERGQREALERQAAAAAMSPTGKTFTNSIGMEFVLIPAGTFMMGCDESTGEECEFEEKPRHEVKISRPFYLGKYEVTHGNYDKATRGMLRDPNLRELYSLLERSYWHEGIMPEDFPMQMNFEGAQLFIEQLNRLEGHKRYRLPTEAEWEYAARAGTTTAYSFGDDKEQLKKYAWFKDNSGERAHQVGEKLPNPWGLYDMHGNMSEMVQDWYDRKYYQSSPAVDPQGPAASPEGFRVARGCSYLSGGYDNPGGCRTARRLRGDPKQMRGYSNWGFRLVLEVED